MNCCPLDADDNNINPRNPCNNIWRQQEEKWAAARLSWAESVDAWKTPDERFALDKYLPKVPPITIEISSRIRELCAQLAILTNYTQENKMLTAAIRAPNYREIAVFNVDLAAATIIYCTTSIGLDAFAEHGISADDIRAHWRPMADSVGHSLLHEKKLRMLTRLRKPTGWNF